uniref:Protein kinase domain-containing protein n=1 Tax=Scylla olivacea TaxID=85551 RepID=A0A0P4WED9_SCYOL
MNRFKREVKDQKQITRNTIQKTEVKQGLVEVVDARQEHVPRYSWEDVRRGKWNCACIWRVRRRELKKDGKTIPVMVKLLASKHERYLLWELRGQPGIPRLLGITDSFPYALLMEMYPGKSFCWQRHFTSHWTCLLALHRVCEVVAALHSRGITHGDLHGTNIIFAVTKGEVNLTLLHFDRATRLEGLAPKRKYEYLLRDLRQLYKLLILLGGLSCVNEYVIFLEKVRSRLEDERPLSAIQLAIEITSILRVYQHRPLCTFFWFGKVRKRINLSQYSSDTSSLSVFPGMITPNINIPEYQTPPGWPPRGVVISTFPWSKVSPQPWLLKCKYPSRAGTLQRDDITVPVVVKLLTPTRERYVLYDLQDVPNVPVLIGITSEYPHALILEKYDGKTFRWLRRVGRPWDCLFGLVQICTTLAALHARGVVHGDVNEKNIVIHSNGSNTSVTLINFEKACFFKLMEEPMSSTILWEELQSVSYLVHLLRSLKYLPEYKQLLVNLRVGNEINSPMPAEAMAQELQSVLEQYPGRLGFFQRYC